VQKALYEVSPWGERRQDLRAAISTSNLIASQSSEKLTDEDFREMVRSMSSYLMCDRDQEETVDMNALERMQRK
tara:strand:- start:1345 stop:1566 length:222 start_codon:yes stop_codon:yes gene_type:complete